MRVPFIAAWAKPDASNPIQKRLPISAGALQTQVASVCDIFPTLLDLLGVKTPKDHPVDGVGLANLLSGKADDSREESFLMHYPHAPHRSDYFTVFRDGDWKLIYHYIPTDVSDGSHYQLYNLKVDPFESTNVANEHPKELKRLVKALADTLENQGAQYPVDENGNSLKPKLP